MDYEEHFGLVSGSAIQSKSFRESLKASFASLLGKDRGDVDEMFEKAKMEAVKSIKAQAAELGANTIINVRFESTRMKTDFCEVHVYGSAVKANPY